MEKSLNDKGSKGECVHFTRRCPRMAVEPSSFKISWESPEIQIPVTLPKTSYFLEIGFCNRTMVPIERCGSYELSSMGGTSYGRTSTAGRPSHCCWPKNLSLFVDGMFLHDNKHLWKSSYFSYFARRLLKPLERGLWGEEGSWGGSLFFAIGIFLWVALTWTGVPLLGFCPTLVAF